MPKVTFRSPAIAQTVSARIWKSIGNVLNEVTLLQVTLLPSALMQVNVIQDDGLCPSLLIRSHPFITTEFQPCVAKGALKHRRHGLRFLKACESLKTECTQWPRQVEPNNFSGKTCQIIGKIHNQLRHCFQDRHFATCDAGCNMGRAR